MSASNPDANWRSGGIASVIRIGAKVKDRSDLHELNYARRILEECGMPCKSNLDLVVDCITALRVKLTCSTVEAARCLWRRVNRVQELEMKMDRPWFRNSDDATCPIDFKNQDFFDKEAREEVSGYWAEPHGTHKEVR